MLLVVTSVIGFISYASIPCFIRIQCAEAAPVPSPVCAKGCGFVGTASGALVAESIEFVGDPALDARRSGSRGAVGSRVLGAPVEGIEVRWWET